ncbi:MAG: CDP-diacylglycerol--glycerol-3-phosphate 3-phosphatidyltransferase [Firmicutes bacterium]|nr:CDP-diacylglycerol--glycerol-3-phosphate 3-phosphatidyltransferase [Bacillota bacterium]
MNVPNKLTVIRMLLIPVCMFFIVFTVIPDTWSRIISTALFIITSLTDMLDGMIARKKNMVTNFGKFLDPVADKLLIIGTFLAILVRYRENDLFVQLMLWSLFIIITREIAVTSLRMICSSSVVIAAGFLGKIKTVSQMLCVIVILLEPVVCPGLNNIPSIIMVIIAAVLTLLSGLSYFKSYWQYIDPRE